MQCNHEDDISILDSDILWRQIGTNHYVFVPKEKRRRLSSNAFQASKDETGFSVLLEKIVKQSNRQARDVVNDKRPWLVSLVVFEIRSLEFGVYRDPLENEQAHANVFDKNKMRGGSESKRMRESMAKMAKWVISPPEVKDEKSNNS